MHRALWLLLWLDLRSGVRAIFRGRRTWRQFGLVLLVFLFVGMIAASQVASVTLSEDGAAAIQSLRFGAAMPFWALLYLLATWLTAAADRGLVMRPAEIHFLVAGPFSTREILTLNLIRLAYRAFVSALFLAIVAWAYMQNFMAGLVGIWLVLSVSLLVGMIASLAARNALPRVVRGTRVVISVVAIAVLALMISQAVQSLDAAGSDLSFSKVAAAAGDSPAGKFVLPPVQWMFAPLQADRFWPDVPLQLLFRLPILIVLVLLVFAIGGGFGEAATERTDRAMARRQASLRSGMSGGGNWFRNFYFSIPDFGRWGGVGSVAWMEMTQAVRLLPRFFLYTAAIVTVILVLPLVIKGERLDGNAGLAWLAAQPTGENRRQTRLKELDEPGLYRLALKADGKDGTSYASDVAFLVRDESRELNSPMADWQMMQNIASASELAGGRLIAPEELPDALQWLRERQSESRVTTLEKRRLGDGVWDSWLYFMLFCTVMTVEWACRKRWQLP